MGILNNNVTVVSDRELPIAVERGISTLVADSIDLAMDAEINGDIDQQNRLARASIVSSLLFLEATANCCLDLLNLGSRFASEIDRLPTIAKYDLFLRIRYRARALDRGRAEVQGYGELKALRDSFVHPRAQRFDWLDWSEDSDVSTSPKSKTLGLTKIPSYCFPDDAITALKATHCFARYFFSECARMKPREVSALLHSEAEIPDLTDSVIPAWPRPVQHWLGRHKINLGYMKLYWHD